MIDILIIVIISVLFILLFSLLVFYYYYKRKFLKQLRNSPNYSTVPYPVNQKIQFTYSSPEDENLVHLRERYDLEKIAGNGSETDKIINLMKWVHLIAYRSPNPSRPEEVNSLCLLKEIKADQRELNCWMYSTILNDVYLSTGFKSRMVNLKSPKEPTGESHFVNAVYSTALKKWIYMDADFGAYFTDEKMNILGLEEIRLKLINGEKLIVNRDSGPRTKKFSTLARVLGKRTYRTYLSKNFYRFMSPLAAEFGYENNKSGRIYVELVPEGYSEEKLDEVTVTERMNTIIYTKNPELFWQL